MFESGLAYMYPTSTSTGKMVAVAVGPPARWEGNLQATAGYPCSDLDAAAGHSDSLSGSRRTAPASGGTANAADNDSAVRVGRGG